MPAGAQLPGKLASSSSPAPVAVKQEKVAASDDPNVATRQTVEKMCEYIQAGQADDLVRWWAECGIQRYGRNLRDPHSLIWAMYWLVKHAIQFARDEPRLFRVGEGDGLDMLIAPAVLVRMAQPKEDCDGFTMLLCALLASVGVRTVIVTIAADPSDPSRWSHVFPMAAMPSGSMVPLDASHGTHPGWMVPRNHIFRWQAWDLYGQPVDVAIPRAGAGLHGYVPRGRRMRPRGMGQTCYDELGNPTDCGDGGDDGSGSTQLSTLPPSTTSSGGASPLPCYYTDGTAVVCGGAAPGSTVGVNPASTSAGANWTSVIQTAIQGAAKDAELALLPAGSYIGANGQIITGGAGASSLLTASGLAGILPIIGIGLVLLLIVSEMEKK
jgi:hypothetical protein